MSEIASTAAADSADEFLGHPRGLYVCFATEMWERFSFYGMKYLLLLYLTKYHLFTDSMGLDVLGGYAALVYAMPVIGGLLADRYLGMRKSVLFGGILLSVEKMNRLIELDTENMVAEVEAGMVTNEFAQDVQKQGLFFAGVESSLFRVFLGIILLFAVILNTYIRRMITGEH